MAESETVSLDDLLQRAQNGDPVAFEELVVRHQRQVLATAYGLLGRWEDAQDAAQEVFVRVHKYLRRFDGSREFGPWLYRMTVNVCRDHHRRRTPDAPLEDVFADPSDAPDRQAHIAEARRVLHEALRRLPEKERAAIVLRDLQGLPAAEVARILEISEATVRSHISNARLRIMQWTQRFRREKP